jgi:HlyD family secretion protein
MSTNQGTKTQGIRKARRSLRASLSSAAVTAVILATGWVLCTRYRSGAFQRESLPAMATVEVDQGDVSLVVTENGILESSVDDVVRCRVESFVGLPVSTPLSGGAPASSLPRNARSSGGSSGSRSREAALTAVAKAMGSVKSRTAAHSGAAPRAGSGNNLDSNSGANAAGAKAAAVASTDSPSAFGSSASLNRSAIRSFQYVVEPHVPLRSTLPDQGLLPITAPPPLSIISILDEGSRVKAGDIVCELDSSALRDAVNVQQLRFAQAKAWVEQATFILEADEIALREYECGLLPQDIELVRQNIGICRIQKEQAARNLEWAQRVFAKGFRTATQVNADAAVLEQTNIALRNAEGTLEQLVMYTGKRIIKARKARIQAIHADLLSLESAFRLERQRLKRIETMIANCTLRAPRDGIIVYASQSYGSGAIDTQIRQGLIVHPMQPIFRLLDAQHIQVRARINESQVARIRPGQTVLIRLEAFPDRPLRGSVAQIVPIPSLAGGSFSDVRTFFATVRIESGAFDALTTGLTAEVDFLVDTRRQVTRVPLESVRWIGDRSFAAAIVATTTGEEWQWRPIALGVTNVNFAEVVTGLEPGDRVVAHSESLPTTDLDLPAPAQTLDLALEGKD